MDHSFVLHIPDAELESEPLAREQILSGTPEVTGKVVWESSDGRQLRGIWQITPGIVTDTEAEERAARPRSRSRAGRRCGWGPGTWRCCARVTARRGQCTRCCGRCM